ncbi:MAG: hypothetical protein N2C14_11250, partial [Planctomycetales bacterium]
HPETATEPEPELATEPETKTDAATSEPKAAADEKWRFRWHKDRWWYRLPAKRWVYWHNDKWNEYDAATFPRTESTGNQQVRRQPVRRPDSYRYGYQGSRYPYYDRYGPRSPSSSGFSIYYGRGGSPYGGYYPGSGYGRGYAPYGSYPGRSGVSFGIRIR